MREIYSKADPEKLLHIVNKMDEIPGGRVDLSPDAEFLQVSTLLLPKGKTFRPHEHILQERETDITQESWVVIRGKVRATLYDLDKSVLEDIDLEQGDCSITFRGGHSYEILEPGTVVYEFKTGPYNGQEKDKVFIGS